MKERVREVTFVALAIAAGVTIGGYFPGDDATGLFSPGTPSQFETVAFEGPRVRVAEVARASVYSGNKKLRKGDGAGAELDYRRATELDPTSSDAWAILGVSQEFQENFAAAEQSQLQALALDPNNARALNSLGGLAYRRRQLHQAISLFKKAHDLEPRRSPPLWGLALAYRDLGLRQEAIESFELFLEFETQPANAAYAREQLHVLKDTSASK